MRYMLNGDDWTVKGWWPYEWKAFIQYPESSHFHGVTAKLPANVPGCVQADLLRHGLIEDPYYGLNSLAAEWVSQRHWMYEKEFEAPTEWADKRLRLHFDGLDYAAEVYLNGMMLFEHEGTFLPVDYDVTEFVRIGEPNLLQVVLMGDGADQSQVGFSSAVRQVRPRFCHKWDFSTRMVHIGIWDDAFISVTDSAFISDVNATCTIERGRALVKLESEVKGIDRDGYVISAALHDGDGAVVVGKSQEVPGSFGDTMMINLELTLDNPKFWWPNGYGQQPLYMLTVRLVNPDGGVSDEQTRQIGIRSLAFSQAEAAPRGSLPYSVLVNGRQVYIKGVNWAPCDHFYGLPNEWRYRWLLRLARDANVNMIRVNGVGLIEKRLFYQLCDRNGIMVWQDFPQSASMLDNTPPMEEWFIDNIEEVAASAVRRRRDHVSLTVWCGGNELFDARGPLDESHPNLARLGSLVRELDGDRLFLPTTPSGPSFRVDTDSIGQDKHHDVHGPWEYEGDEHYRLFNVSDSLLHSETGAPGAASRQSLERMMPARALWPPTAENPYWRHHGEWWLNRDKLEQWFGRLADIEQFCRASRFIQMEADRYAIESNRRRKFKNCGTLIWAFNEPWPACTNLSLVDYYGNTKPAYDAVRRAFAPRLVSLQYDSLNQPAGARFTAHIFANNAPAALRGCRVTWAARTLTGEVIARGEEAVNLPDNSVAGPFELSFDVPDGLPGQVFIIELRLNGKENVLAGNAYIFTTTTEPYSLRPLLELPAARLETGKVERATEGSVVADVRNTGDCVALWVRWESALDTLVVNSRHNGTILWPGESAQFRIILAQRVNTPKLRLSAFNAAEQVIEVGG